MDIVCVIAHDVLWVCFKYVRTSFSNTVSAPLQLSPLPLSFLKKGQHVDPLIHSITYAIMFFELDKLDVGICPFEL